MLNVRTEFQEKVKVIENIFIPMRDGTQLAAKIWLPQDAGQNPVPAIFELIPYRKRDGTRTRDQGIHMYFAGHGYASLRVDIRGSGDSEGIITDEYTPQEQQDGCEIIAWLAQQPWCDGQVAMIGISWGGFNGLQIAALQPSALKTIITVGSTDDRYATDVHYVGGCLSKDNFDWSSTMFAHNDLPPDPVIVGEKWRDMWMQRIKANEPWIIPWLQHQRRDGYWKQGSVCGDFSKIKIPVYAVSGWADNYSESIPRLLAGLGGPRLGLIGPWAHSYPHDVAVGPAIGWLQEALRWFDHWMKGRDTGIMREPMLRVWMQESVPPQTCYLERAGRWVGETQWPSPRIMPTIFHLNRAGALQARKAKSSATTICSPLWVGLAAGEVGRYGEDAEWPTDQREDDGGSLVFVSEPLKARTEILGAPKLHLTFSSNKPQALVAVRVNDVMPDGRSTRVAIGLLNLTHRDSHQHATALTPGKVETTIVELDDIAHAFPAGHRIAVSISTTYWPIAWPSPELATLTVHTGESRLELPVRPPRKEDEAMRVFDPPEAAPQTPYISHDLENTLTRRVTRELLTGKMTVDFPRWTFRKDMRDIGVVCTSTALARYEITDGDPSSATLSTDYMVELARPDTTIRHHSTGRLTCDHAHFIVEMSLDVSENGTSVFKRQWHERIARDMV